MDCFALRLFLVSFVLFPPQPETVYDYQAADNADGYTAVQCPLPKAKGKIERAFRSYVTISTGDGSTDLTVEDARSGDTAGRKSNVTDV